MLGDDPLGSANTPASAGLSNFSATARLHKQQLARIAFVAGGG
ncbi:MAG: hypothetical protein ACRED8_11510 [Caulobacteraceae bacterium]